MFVQETTRNNTMFLTLSLHSFSHNQSRSSIIEVVSYWILFNTHKMVIGGARHKLYRFVCPVIIEWGQLMSPPTINIRDENHLWGITPGDCSWLFIIFAGIHTAHSLCALVLTKQLCLYTCHAIVSGMQCITTLLVCSVMYVHGVSGVVGSEDLTVG